MPITIETAKNFLKINNTHEDELIISLIKSATRVFESYTGRALILQDWQVLCKQFAKLSITLPIRPAIEVIKIELVDYYHKSSLFNSKHYTLEPDSSELFFSVIPFSNSVRIEYRAGYGKTPADIPDEIKTALLSHIAFLYEYRESGSQFNLSVYEQFRNMKI